jgi:hypothetical protein
MFWTDRINRVAGIALLLLAALVIVSIIAESAVTDADPSDREEVEEFVLDINDNEAWAFVQLGADIAADAGLGIIAAAGLYIVFRDRNRLLALFGFALILGGSAAFIAGDAASVPLIFLAEDFAEKGGPGGIGAGDAVILETARAIAMWSFTVDQIACTAIGIGLFSLGLLIAWAPAGPGPVPPRWIGGFALLAGVATVLSYLAALSEGVGIAFFIISALAMLLFLISLGVWLVGQSDRPESGPEPSAAG